MPKNSTNPASPDSISFPGLPSSTQTAWRNILRGNLTYLNNSRKLDELLYKLNGLKIPGVGSKTIRRTAEWICKYNDNIDRESNCFSLLSQAAKTALRKKGITNSDQLRLWINKDHPELSGKREIEIVSYLNKNVNQII